MQAACAYVFVLFGARCEQYFLGIVSVVRSLIKHFCVHQRVLMHTRDVPRAVLDLAVNLCVFDEIIPTDYIEASEMFFNNPQAHQRFGKIFTKYRVLGLDRHRAGLGFKKVLLLDSDLHVRSNLDHLFELDAPAAMQRGPNKPPMRAQLPARAPINAGVVLLQPDSRVLDTLLQEITGPSPRRLPGYNSPDADYLTEHPIYSGKWTSIPLEYNFQLEFDALDPRAGTVRFSSAREEHFSKDGAAMPWENVQVVHFSGMKPWAALLDDASPLLRGLRTIGSNDAGLQAKLAAGIHEYAHEVATLQGLCSQLELGEGVVWREARAERAQLPKRPEQARMRLHALLPLGGRWFEGQRPATAVWIPPGAGLAKPDALHDRCKPVAVYLEVAGSAGPIVVGNRVLAKLDGTEQQFEVTAIKDGVASLRRKVVLSPEWECAEAPPSEETPQGRPYYYNTRSGLCQWEFPNLPRNWQCVSDPVTGDQYYYKVGSSQPAQWDPPDFEDLELRLDELRAESVAADRVTCSDVTIWRRSFLEEEDKEALKAMREALELAKRSG